MAGELWALLEAHENLVEARKKTHYLPMGAEEAEYFYSKGLLDAEGVEYELCIECGEPCLKDECNSDGEPIHEKCIANRIARLTDAEYDRRMMK